MNRVCGNCPFGVAYSVCHVKNDSDHECDSSCRKYVCIITSTTELTSKALCDVSVAKIENKAERLLNVAKEWN